MDPRGRGGKSAASVLQARGTTPHLDRNAFGKKPTYRRGSRHDGASHFHHQLLNASAHRRIPDEPPEVWVRRAAAAFAGQIGRAADDPNNEGFALHVAGNAATNVGRAAAKSSR